MDHVEINQKQSQRQKGTTTDSEAVFWCNMLYAIGSHIIDTTQLVKKGLSSESASKDTFDDPLTKIFCGYWILYNIAIMTDSDNVS